MNKELINSSEINNTSVSEANENSMLTRIKKERDNFSAYAALVGIIITMSGIIIKGVSLIALAGYNNYFSINSTYDHISETNILSNIINVLFLGIVLFVLNSFVAYVIIKSKCIPDFLLKILCIYVISMVVLFKIVCIALNYNSLNLLKQMQRSDYINYIISLSIICLCVYYFGMVIGIISKVKLSQRLNQQIDKLFNKITGVFNALNIRKKQILALLICSFIIIGIFLVYSVGNSFATLKTNYRLVDNNCQVILAEKDGMYLCAECSFDTSNNQLVIYTNKQVCIVSENVDVNIIKAYDVSIANK